MAAGYLKETQTVPELNEMIQPQTETIKRFARMQRPVREAEHMLWHIGGRASDS